MSLSRLGFGAGCGTRLYRFLIIAFLSTLPLITISCSSVRHFPDFACTVVYLPFFSVVISLASWYAFSLLFVLNLALNFYSDFLCHFIYVLVLLLISTISGASIASLIFFRCCLWPQSSSISGALQCLYGETFSCCVCYRLFSDYLEITKAVVVHCGGRKKSPRTSV